MAVFNSSNLAFPCIQDLEYVKQGSPVCVICKFRGDDIVNKENVIVAERQGFILYDIDYRWRRHVEAPSDFSVVSEEDTVEGVVGFHPYEIYDTLEDARRNIEFGIEETKDFVTGEVFCRGESTFFRDELGFQSYIFVLKYSNEMLTLSIKNDQRFTHRITSYELNFHSLTLLFDDDSYVNAISDDEKSVILYKEDLEQLCTKTLKLIQTKDKEGVIKTIDSIDSYSLFYIANKFKYTLESYGIFVLDKEETVFSQPASVPCYVYLMIDHNTGYYKIGISKRPKRRESTLQSEKPTIEMLACKQYPDRKIALAIEKALHSVYSNKHIRGEWYSLNENEVVYLENTLT